MESNFRILDFAEKDLSLPTPLNNNNDEFEIEFKPLIRFSEKNKVINVQIEVSYIENEHIILNYGVEISFKQIKEDDSIVLTDKDVLKHLIDVSLGFVRGAMATYTKNTPFKKYILPLVNPENLLNKSTLIDIDKR